MAAAERSVCHFWFYAYRCLSGQACSPVSSCLYLRKLSVILLPTAYLRIYVSGCISEYVVNAPAPGNAPTQPATPRPAAVADSCAQRIYIQSVQRQTVEIGKHFLLLRKHISGRSRPPDNIPACQTYLRTQVVTLVEAVVALTREAGEVVADARQMINHLCTQLVIESQLVCLLVFPCRCRQRNAVVAADAIA